jgi:hypothetical protein
MARPKKISDEQRTAIVAEALPLLGGVMIEPLVGRGEIRKAVRIHLEGSQIFAAVNTLSAQPFVLRVQGEPVTLPSSAQSYFDRGGARELLMESERNERPRDGGRFLRKPST